MISAFCQVAICNFAFGVDTGAGIGNVDMVREAYNNTDLRIMWSGSRIIGPGQQGGIYSVPTAGTYTATVLWARTAGTGTMHQDATDWYSFTIEEML